MKKVLPQIPVLCFALGLFLLFFPTTSSDYQSHNHSVYLFSTILPSIIVIISLLRITNILRSINRFQLITITVFVLFAFFNFSPLSSVSKYHHQQASTIDHPCCMPQIATNIQEITLRIIISPISQFPVIMPAIQQLSLTTVTNSRSPPYIS